ncbi:MAG: hypothetical protein ACR2NY_06345 [Alphaproteobacteria bacterium]
MEKEDKKRITAIFGEMNLAMDLHNKGWLVYRSYIDEYIDFIIARYYCKKCKEFTSLEKRTREGTSKSGSATFPTNLCDTCQTDSIKIITRFLQVKTAEGVEPRIKKYKNLQCKDFSFHAKLRSNVDDRAFYAWIALMPMANNNEKLMPYYYIFNHTEINKFDDINIPSYQKTDNQQTHLYINPEIVVKNEGKKYNFDCFNKDFFNNFAKLEEIKNSDGI